jgi:ATP-binding cassette subfamily B protein
MLSFLAPVKWHTLLALVIFMGSIGAEVWVVYLLKTPVDIVQQLGSDQSGAAREALHGGFWHFLASPQGSGAALRVAIIWLVAAQMLRSVLYWGRSIAFSWQNMSTISYMRAAVYDRLQRVGFAFYDRYSTGHLINRAISDLKALRQFLVVGLRAAVDVTFTFVAYLGMLALCSPLLALAALIPIPFWLWALRSYARRTRPIYQRQRSASDEVMRVITENISGAHVVRAFATEQFERQKFNAAQATLFERLLAGIGLQQRMLPLLRGIVVFSQVGLFTWGACWVQSGQFQLGDLVVFGVAMNAILGKLQQLNMITEAYQRAMVSCGRLLEIIDTPDATPELPGATRLRHGPGTIAVKGVTFGFRDNTPVLRDVSIDIPAGALVALVGPTGSGKSTLAALLGRCYDPSRGTVEIDGQDVRTATVRSVHTAVGYVFQENYLFNDTVARNIAYADVAAPMADIKQAARVAQADEFIERLPDKYDTLLGEFGLGLSGGQRQRLALARAVLHNPRVLILDDALSAVDAVTETRILAELERFRNGRTLIMITSRMVTARKADFIVVLENGQVTQIGTHNELMARSGYYLNIAAAQFGVTDVDAGQVASHIARELRKSRRWTEVQP